MYWFYNSFRSMELCVHYSMYLFCGVISFVVCNGFISEFAAIPNAFKEENPLYLTVKIVEFIYMSKKFYCLLHALCCMKKLFLMVCSCLFTFVSFSHGLVNLCIVSYILFLILCKLLSLYYYVLYFIILNCSGVYCCVKLFCMLHGFFI